MNLTANNLSFSEAGKGKGCDKKPNVSSK